LLDSLPNRASAISGPRSLTEKILTGLLKDWRLLKGNVRCRNCKLAILLGMTVALGPLLLDAYSAPSPADCADLNVGHTEYRAYPERLCRGSGPIRQTGGALSDRYGSPQIILSADRVCVRPFWPAAMVAQSEQPERKCWRFGWAGTWRRLLRGSVPAIVRGPVHGKTAARCLRSDCLVMFIAPQRAPTSGDFWQFGPTGRRYSSMLTRLRGCF